MAFRITDSSPIFSKLLVVGTIVLALLLPLTMLKGLISERAAMRDQAYETVAQGWGGRITTGGPMLRVPYDTTHRTKEGETITTRHQLYVLANELRIKVDLQPEAESRHVGIYQVPVYIAHLTMTGAFSKNAIKLAGQREGAVQWSHASIRLPLSDVRNVRELKNAHFGTNELKFRPAEPGVYRAIEAKIDLEMLAAADSRDANEDGIAFAIDISLAGSQAIALLPLAATTHVSMQSTWPHPQFSGAFLPANHHIENNGFTAAWQVLELNRGFSQAWSDAQVDDNQLLGASFGVGLFQSVDVYQRSERAVKYALLFIALTFLSIYAWEIIGAAPVHPVQYLFVGLALSMFYLLLIALSEHLHFWLAYWAGAIALIALLGIYTAGAMRSTRRGIAIAALMSLIYALLYLLVLSESYSLLMGAIALFIALAVVMLATRKVKWYGETPTAA